MPNRLTLGGSVPPIIMASLGPAYAIRINGDRAENIERAIGSYWAALEVYTREAFPRDWARTMANLGRDYLLREKGDREENRERAIECLEATLTERTPEHNPEQWSATMAALGIAYRSRTRGGGEDNLRRGAEYLTAAAEMRERLGLPYEAHESYTSLGDLFFLEEKI